MNNQLSMCGCQLNLPLCNCSLPYKIYPSTTDNVVYFVSMEKGHQKATLTERYTMKDIDFGINEIYNKLYDKRIK